MNERAIKALAVVLLGIAIGCIALSVRATLRAGAIQGPSALVVTGSGELWLGVDQALWRISREGRLLDAQPVRATGLPAAPANLVRSPDGAVIASVRGDAALYFLDPATARVVRTLAPEWPADLLQHGKRAINLAVRTDGHIAVATGGGHAVALFDPQGRFVARTAPGTYDFSNGLWWSADGLWTTDTNRFTLRLLDAASLTQLSASPLADTEGGSFLGPARANASAAAALIRYRGDMTGGIVTRIGPGASVTALPHSAELEPRDVDWLDDGVLATDGASFSILHWSGDGQALPAFGDAALLSRLSALAQERDALRASYGRWLIAGICVLLAGGLCAAAAEWLVRRKHPRPALDLSRLGTPRMSRAQLWRSQLRINGWVVLPCLPLLLVGAMPKGSLSAAFGLAAGFVALGAAVASLLGLAILVALLPRRMKRMARLPENEALFNQAAVSRLSSHGSIVAQALRGGEHVIETFALMPGLSWWVLTDQRLLGYAMSLFEPRLTATHELGDVATASCGDSAIAAISRLAQPGVDDAKFLTITLIDGRQIRGTAGSPVLASRVAQQLTSLSAALRGRAGARARPDAVDARAHGLPWRRALASALLPGLGQWQQRRTKEAIVFLVVWVATVIFLSGPMLWTLIEPFTAVSELEAQVVALWHLLWSAFAAADAWRAEAPLARPAQRQRS